MTTRRGFLASALLVTLVATAVGLSHPVLAIQRKEVEASSVEAALKACAAVASELGFRITSSDAASGRLRAEWEVQMERVHRIQLRGTSGMMTPEEKITGGKKDSFVLDIGVKRAGSGKVDIDVTLKQPDAEHKNNRSSVGTDEEFYRTRPSESPDKDVANVFFAALQRQLRGEPTGITAAAKGGDPSLRVGPNRQASGKTVAVFSIYGPPDVSAGILKKLSQTDNLNQAEESVVSLLQRGGWQVVPLAETKKLVETEYDETYKGLVPQKVRDDLTKQAKQARVNMDWWQAMRVKAGVGSDGRASANTSILADYMFPENTKVTGFIGPSLTIGEIPKYTDTFVQTLTLLTKKLNADAFVILRLVPTVEDLRNNPQPTKGDFVVDGGKTPGSGNYALQAATLMMYAADGVALVRRRLIGLSSKRIDSGTFSFKFDNDGVNAGLKSATDTVLASLIQEVNERQR